MRKITTTIIYSLALLFTGVLSKGFATTYKISYNISNSLDIHSGTNTFKSSQPNNSDILDSDGNIIWNSKENQGFNYNIAGIGRDDKADLNRKKSKCENSGSLITIGLAEMTTNSGEFHNKDFLMWGNNNDLLSSGTKVVLDLSAGINDPDLKSEVQFSPIQRIWKVIETYESGTGVPEVTVTIPKRSLDDIISSKGEYLMFISDSPNFDSNSKHVAMSSVEDNLEANYDFNGTKYITFGYAPEQKFKRSILFDGSQTYVDMKDNLDLDKSFSISTWIMRKGAGTILSKRDSNFTKGYELKIKADNLAEFKWIDSAGSAHYISSKVEIPANKWHQLALTYDNASGDIMFYIDGVLNNTSTSSAPPTSNSNAFLIGATGDNYSPKDFFSGHIDEVRIWDNALSQNEIRFIMNQEIEESLDGHVKGNTLPNDILKNEGSTLPWNKLRAYFPMSTYVFTNVKDESKNGLIGALKNLNTVDRQTAPLPYESQQDGSWSTPETWLNNKFQALPNSRSISDKNITVDWNIVKTNHNVETGTNRTVMALLVGAKELSAVNDNKIEVTHYLKLDGTINLLGEAQLLQDEESELDKSSIGYLLRRQQGNADLYNYNYWSSPVSPENIEENNKNYTIRGVMKDESTGSINNLYFSGSYSGSPSSPATLSSYWLNAFRNIASDYSNWESIGESTDLKVGQGWTMKGPGTGRFNEEYNYVFKGKPNNSSSKSPIQLEISSGNSYLVGNPFPSALDTDQFILNNTFLTGAIYFWEHWGASSHTSSDYQGGYATVTLAGEVKAMGQPQKKSQQQSGLKTHERYIPVGKGFFVEASSDGVLSFKNEDRAFAREEINLPSNFSATSVEYPLQSDDAMNDAIDERKKLRLGFYNKDGVHREILLTEDSNTTEGYDRMYDAENYEELPDDLNWKINNIDAVIQSIPEISNGLVLPLKLKIEEAGEFKISLDSLLYFNEDIGIGLKDKVNETITNLRVRDHIQMMDAGTYTDRFELVFKIYNQNLSTEEVLNKEDAVIFYRNSDRNIVVTKKSSFEIQDATLFSILGQKIADWEFQNQNSDKNLPLSNCSPGTYILKLNTNKGSITKKIMIN